MKRGHLPLPLACLHWRSCQTGRSQAVQLHQTVQSTERPIDVMRSIAPGIVGNLSGGDIADAGNKRAE